MEAPSEKMASSSSRDLSPEQVARVRYLVEDRWVSSNHSESWDSFKRILAQMSSEELHEFIKKMNWDGNGATRAKCVLAHPKCDRGTALMIYWRTDPIFYLKYGTRERVAKELWPAAVEYWDMIRDIELRLGTPNSFITARIPYDPQNDEGRDRTKQRRKRRPIQIIEKQDDAFIKVAEKSLPDDPEIDVKKMLPPVVFKPINL